MASVLGASSSPTRPSGDLDGCYRQAGVVGRRRERLRRIGLILQANEMVGTVRAGAPNA